MRDSSHLLQHYDTNLTVHTTQRNETTKVELCSELYDFIRVWPYSLTVGPVLGRHRHLIGHISIGVCTSRTEASMNVHSTSAQLNSSTRCSHKKTLKSVICFFLLEAYCRYAGKQVVGLHRSVNAYSGPLVR